MTQDLSYFRNFGEQVEQRLNKLEQFELAYPPRVKRTHSTAEALKAYEAAGAGGETEEKISVGVVGRLVAVRNMGKSTFAHVEDGTGRIQLYLKRDELGEEQYDRFNKNFDLGDFVAAQGYLFRTRTGEVTVHVIDFQLASKALRPLPEKWHGLKDTETRYRNRYLDLIANPEVRDIFIKRTKAVTAMRKFLDNEGFLEVETPTLQPLYGGAMARPFVTHHNALDMDLYLRISDELYLKRLIVGGFDKVYEICKDFRNEGISTKHNPEFTMMECYWAYADYQDMMRLTENMLSFITQQVLGSTVLVYNGNEIDLAPPWRRVSLPEAIQEQTGINIFDSYPDVKALWAECQARKLNVTPQSSWGETGGGTAG